MEQTHASTTGITLNKKTLLLRFEIRTFLLWGGSAIPPHGNIKNSKFLILLSTIMITWLHNFHDIGKYNLLHNEGLLLIISFCLQLQSNEWVESKVQAKLAVNNTMILASIKKIMDDWLMNLDENRARNFSYLHGNCKPERSSNEAEGLYSFM